MQWFDSTCLCLDSAFHPKLDGVSIPRENWKEFRHEFPSPGASLNVFGGSQADIEALAGLGYSATPIFQLETLREGYVPRLWRPPPVLAGLNAGGSCLVLGCGSGRDAVHLAGIGWKVTAIDRLEDAIERGRSLERRYTGGKATPIQWRCEDLRSFDTRDRFDMICACRFWHEGVLNRAMTWANPGATFAGEFFISVGNPEAWATRIGGEQLVMRTLVSEAEKKILEVRFNL